MFWRKEKSQQPQKADFPHPYRFCYLYISEKFQHIMYVSYGKVDAGFHAELDNVIADTWPCDFAKLQMNIEEALGRYLPSTNYVKGNWPSYNNSKAKSQSSFETDYIRLLLETDHERSYKEGEVERIRVTGRPTSLDNTYSLVGSGHLLDTKIAQIVIDIFDACMKIRS